VPVPIDRDDGVVIAVDYHHNVVQLCEARGDNPVAFNFPSANEVKPDTCAMLEDTVPANELNIIYRQVALCCPLTPVLA
jgi:hypothetical protein